MATSGVAILAPTAPRASQSFLTLPPTMDITRPSKCQSCSRCISSHKLDVSLAISRMFGGFSQSFWTTYHQHMPKTEPVDEYELRLDLYQLYHYLNHTVLFGVRFVIHRACAFSDDADELVQSFSRVVTPPVRKRRLTDFYMLYHAKVIEMVNVTDAYTTAALIVSTVSERIDSQHLICSVILQWQSQILPMAYLIRASMHVSSHGT